MSEAQNLTTPEVSETQTEAVQEVAPLPEFYAIPREVGEELLKYLGTRPAGDVFGLIQKLLALQPITLN